ncbi:uncharacterized protein LOC103519401 [Gryllus bimaculatus]|nr:uncharacterized protein LOC103519401 [Gryllus bimaculatus]
MTGTFVASLGRQGVWFTGCAIPERLERARETPCPVLGEYTGVIPDAQGLCARLASDCASPEAMFYAVSECTQAEVYEGSPIRTWPVCRGRQCSHVFPTACHKLTACAPFLPWDVRTSLPAANENVSEMKSIVWLWLDCEPLRLTEAWCCSAAAWAGRWSRRGAGGGASSPADPRRAVAAAAAAAAAAAVAAAVALQGAGAGVAPRALNPGRGRSAGSFLLLLLRRRRRRRQQLLQSANQSEDGCDSPWSDARRFVGCGTSLHVRDFYNETMGKVSMQAAKLEGLAASAARTLLRASELDEVSGAEAEVEAGQDTLPSSGVVRTGSIVGDGEGKLASDTRLPALEEEYTRNSLEKAEMTGVLIKQLSEETY